MKVFYCVQVANTTTVDGKPKWLLESDAVSQIDIGLSKCLMDIDPNISFMFKFPRLQDVADVKSYLDFFEAKYHSRIDFYYEEIPFGPICSRYSFLFNEHAKNIDRFKDIDVMINDENTLTKNWRALFNVFGLNIPIITTNYFLDSPISSKVDKKIRYYERQMESFVNADIAAFQCKASLKEAKEAFCQLYKPEVWDNEVNANVWGIGCHAAEIEKYATDEKFEKPTIYFGNRITETANRYNNWHIFAKAIGEAARLTDRDFDAIILNPTRKITNAQINEILSLSNGKIKIIPNESKDGRKEYLEFINKADISCNLYTNEVHGGVTHAEAMLAKNITIMPKINNYLDKFEVAGIEYPFFCGIKSDNSIDIESLVAVIVQAVNCIGTEAEKRWKKTCRDVAYEYESYEKAASRILNDINSLVANKEKV